MKRPLIFVLAVLVCIGAVAMVRRMEIVRTPLSSGRTLTPTGSHVGVGSFPSNMILSPDGRFIVVTDSGFREQLTVLETTSGEVVDRLEFNDGGRGEKNGLYFGLAFVTENGLPVLYASRGSTGIVSRYRLDSAGKLNKLEGDLVIDESLRTGPIAGICFDAMHDEVVIAVNRATEGGDHHGDVLFFNVMSRKQAFMVTVPGYPLDLACVNGKTFVSCERDGVVIALKDGVPGPPIKTGSNPTRLTVSPDKQSIYVTNSGSDTVSQIDVTSEKVKSTFLLRPNSLRGLPISTPLGEAMYGSNMLVACGDLNAVAVVDPSNGHLKGLIPTGWYPSAVAVKGDSLFVASAKGIETHSHPNGAPTGPNGTWGQYPPNIIEGTVSRIGLKQALADLPKLTAATLENDRLTRKRERFTNPGIKHVIYVIKENRTYDQVFGDIKEGNGDASLTMFGEAVTPNQHALAKRFTLLDNFYDCAEVSADGWNWSTSGMVNEYNARNVVNNYSGRRGDYDFEGTNAGYAPDLEGLSDVSTAPGGYIWDDAVQHNVSLRNYGFFVRGMKRTPGQPLQMEGVKKVLKDRTDSSFPEFDLSFADSPLWQQLNKTGRNQKKKFGAFGSASRFDEWKREFDGYVKNGDMPGLTLLRLPRDHTAGTAAGQWSPRAMVADNDYAVGKLVEAVSHSPYWKSTVICVLEDDAQNGFDHVDCHRSTALVISPYMERGRVDGHFYNTDSMLKTIESVLGLPPMSGFDATADFIAGLSGSNHNDEPFDAVVPKSSVAGEINKASAYRSADSERLIALTHEESAADLQLNDILWGALKAHKPKPPIRGTVDSDGDGD